MAPCGCSFAFRREVFNLVGAFDERTRAFHEESIWGTQMAGMLRGAYCLAYPRPYHAVSGTFSCRPEIDAGRLMRESRAVYKELFNVPEDAKGSGFEYVHPRVMANMPSATMRYLRPDYTHAPDTRKLVGGETVEIPHLVEWVQGFPYGS